MTKLVLAVTVLTLCSVSFAETPRLKKIKPQQKAASAAAQETAAQVTPPATFLCSYTFTSGVNNTYLKYCVTVNGNITYLETPLGHAHIGGEAEFSSFGEGYGICNESPATEYHDYAGFGDSGNWGSPTLLSLTATAVTIARTTTDSNWTLTQTITQQAATSSIKVVMTLKNNTGVARVAYLSRYADADADAQFLNSLDATQDSAFAWNTSSPPALNLSGLKLQDVGNSPFPYTQGFAQNIPQGPNACAFAFNSPGGTLIGTNGSLVLAYVASIPAGGSKTATMTYKGL